jgi:hypothetical protein
MKLFRIGAFALLALTAVAVTSCSKYEEGSKFTLLSAKARLVNTWTLVAATSDGTDIMGFMPDMKIEIKKDGTYTTTWTSGGLSTSDSGTWAFNSDKTQVAMTDSNGDVSNSKIIMLKNKDLKLQDADNTSSVDIFTFEGE